MLYFFVKFAATPAIQVDLHLGTLGYRTLIRLDRTCEEKKTELPTYKSSGHKNCTNVVGSANYGSVARTKNTILGEKVSGLFSLTRCFC